MQLQAYNMVNYSFYPYLITISVSVMMLTLTNFMWLSGVPTVIKISNIPLVLGVYFFLMNLNNENNFMGGHSKMKDYFTVNGFMLFILSETMVFVSMFWGYIHNAYAPNQYMGWIWPPLGITTSNPTSMIIFGTSILLSSSFVIMMSHNNLIKNNKSNSMLYLFITLVMGLLFMDMQVLEMSNMMFKLQFSFNDSIFSSSFLMTTSLHASHVLIGGMLLYFSMNMLNNNNNNSMYYINLDMSIWYWHFVDYIWVVVFTLFYYLNK